MTTKDMKFDLARKILLEGSWKHHDELIIVPENNAAWNNAACEVILHKVTEPECLLQLNTSCSWKFTLKFIVLIAFCLHF